MSDIKNTLKDAGQKVADTAKSVGHAVSEKAGEAAEWVKEKTGLGEQNCGPAKRVADIQPHMKVISSCGCTVGKVDHLEGNTVKLTKNDSPDGQHHFVPTEWVARVDEHVHLSKNADDTKREWKSSAAACAV